MTTEKTLRRAGQVNKNHEKHLNSRGFLLVMKIFGTFFCFFGGFHSFNENFQRIVKNRFAGVGKMIFFHTILYPLDTIFAIFAF